MDSFWENRKKLKNGCFLAIFGLILAMFLTSQPYDFDAFAHAEKFEIFMKRSGEKKNKKNSTIA